MNQNITIAELKPAIRGAYLLRFQVTELTHNADNADQINLKVADQTGCIDAWFSHHGKHIKIGQVYQLQNFRCKVINHHLRLQLVKQSKLARVKFDMAFKDLVNDMSEKFYVSKVEHQTLHGKVTEKKAEKSEQSVQKEKEKSQQQKNSKQTKKQPQKITTKPDQTKKQAPKDKGKAQNESRNYNDRRNNEVKYSKEASSPKEPKYTTKQEQKPSKKKYVLKKEQETRQEEPKQRILLKDIYRYREKDVNLFVQLHTKTAIVANNYLLVRAADISGSAYLEFDRRSQLQDKTWYCLRRFKVFADKKYGFIASQQDYSTYDILGDYDEVPDRSPIYFPKAN